MRKACAKTYLGENVNVSDPISLPVRSSNQKKLFEGIENPDYTAGLGNGALIRTGKRCAAQTNRVQSDRKLLQFQAPAFWKLSEMPIKLRLFSYRRQTVSNEGSLAYFKLPGLSRRSPGDCSCTLAHRLAGRYRYPIKFDDRDIALSPDICNRASWRHR